MSDRLIDVAEVLRRMAKALDGLEEGEAVAFALRIMEEASTLRDENSDAILASAALLQQIGDLERENAELRKKIEEAKEGREQP